MEKIVRVLSTLALMGAVRHLAGRFERETGIRIDADFAPTIGLLERLRSGEGADVVILTKEALDLAAKGTVAPDSCADLARSFVGIAVKAGTAHPDISTEAALRKTLLGARSVAYSRIGASGIFFAGLIEQMGIVAEINARATITSGFTAERLVDGEADLAIQQLSELKQVAGVELVGPLPLHLQSRPAVFSAGRLAASQRVQQSAALLKFLASPEVAPALRESGLEPEAAT
jgi:molybdate transport system substrate-binding protein